MFWKLIIFLYISLNRPHTVIDVPIILNEDESIWLTHYNSQILGYLFLALFVFASIVRILSSIYWRYVGYDLFLQLFIASLSLSRSSLVLYTPTDALELDGIFNLS